MNLEPCWDAGDILGWGKAQGRAETSALWTHSLWKASPCQDLIKEQLALHAKPCPIGWWSHCSTGCGISKPCAHSSAPPGPQSPKLPPFRSARSPPDQASQACQAGDPQTFTISGGLHPSGLLNWHSISIHNLCSCWPTPLRPAKACTISALLDLVPKACQDSNPQAFTISARLCPQGMLSWWSTGTEWSLLCQAAPWRPAPSCRIFTPLRAPLRPAKLVIHRHSWSPLGYAPHAYTGLHELHLAVPLRPAKPAIHRHTRCPLHWAHALQAHQAHAPKTC
jgi:hypothetical protein